MIYATARSNRNLAFALTSHLKKITTWMNDWRIKINVDKTEAIMFTLRRKPSYDKYKVKIFNKPIKWSEDVKYLGVILDKRLTFSKHTHTQINKFRAARKILYPLIARNSTLSLENKLLIYTSLLRPILTYGCQVWSYIATTHINNLSKSQNAVIRQIVDAQDYIKNVSIYNEISVPEFINFIAKLTSKFHDTLPNCNNETLNEIPMYDETLPGNRKRPRAGLNLT